VILVVDHAELLRELLALHLTGAGYKVALAEDAIVAGHHILRAGVPDLMIIDVHVPYLDGIEFVAALKADRSVSSFPVLFLSADSSAAERAYAVGAADFLTKPILADRLLDVVQKKLLPPRAAVVPISAAKGS
jgi:DNA-binding response OmpR family regulator